MTLLLGMAKPVRSERVTIRVPKYVLRELRARSRKDALPLNFIIVSILCADSVARKDRKAFLSRTLTESKP